MTRFNEFINFLVSLIAIINPIAIAPIFVSLTSDDDLKSRNQTALQGAIASAAIMLVSFLMGNTLLVLLGIDIYAFQVAGGMLILIMGLSMAQGRSNKHQPTTDSRGSVAVVPLALPVTTGPGVISTLIVYASLNRSLISIVTGSLIIGLATLVIYITFRSAPTIAKRLGQDGLSIITRISGLILAAIGVKFILVGVGKLLPGLQ